MCYPKHILDCYCFLCCCPGVYQEEDEDSVQAQDASAASLSYVGQAAYDILRTKHNRFHHAMWNITSATVVGELQQTPAGGFPRKRDPGKGHDDWLADKIGDIISKTKVWCDVMTLSPPDGLFLTKVKEALATIAKRAKNGDPITIRMMFGNIVGIPVNCEKVIKQLTSGLPQNANIRLWVGAWRKGVSWNHAKIIAVDGRYLHTGGHNMWHHHYMENNPVHDLSFEMEGRVANDAHRFANEQWNFIKRIQITFCGWIVDKLPDNLPLPAKTRVTVSEYPRGKATIFPPSYDKHIVEVYDRLETDVPVISMGRQGTLHWRARPSDDAIVAMLGSAKTIIHLVLQDLGPVCIPGTKIPLPGCEWPKDYLSVLGRVIWEKGVDVEIILSNPGSIPGGLNATEACYGNGWSAVDVAAEIIKTIRVQFPEAKDTELRNMVAENLRVCILKDFLGNSWQDGATLGLHSKHFIVDDRCAYVGSQNLYICDLAEWGVVVDHEPQVQQMMTEYWNPMWSFSFTGDDCDVQEVMDGLDIDRSAESQDLFMSPIERRRQKMKMAAMQTPTRTMDRLDSSLYREKKRPE